MENAKKYWFPAKRYGWGWDIPTSWQGWVTLFVYAACMAFVAHAVSPAAHSIGFVVIAAILTAALVAVCWIKGEPPRWRWGDRSQDQNERLR